MSRIIVLLALALMATAVVFGALPGTSRFMRLLQDSAHAPAFACVAWLGLRLSRNERALWTDSPWRRYAIVAAGALVLGVAIELLQRLIGRDASLLDVARDAAGIVVGLCVAAALDATVSARMRWRLVWVAVIVGSLLLLPFARSGYAYWQRATQFPVLFDSQARNALYFLQPSGARVAKLDHVVELQFGMEPWPGISFDEPIPNWSAYRELALDISNPTSDAIAITVRVHDRVHDFSYADRLNREFVLAPNVREIIRIPLMDIARAPAARTMNLGNLADVTLFRSDGIAGGRVWLYRIWLQ